MNLAILILFWSLLGWKFAFAEFFGGIVIIAVVAAGITLVFRPEELRALAAGAGTGIKPSRVTACLQCGMQGWDEHAVEFEGTRLSVLRLASRERVSCRSGAGAGYYGHRGGGRAAAGSARCAKRVPGARSSTSRSAISRCCATN